MRESVLGRDGGRSAGGDGWGRRRRRLKGILIVVFVMFFVTVGARKPVIRELAVPAVADMREPVTLWCRFDLAGARLYSVKWYKDDQEFFRFMPDETPKAQTFPVPFVTLDESKSDKERVTLVELTLNSSGAFRCEVSVEAPSFDTAHQSANMSVMALPRDAPQIEGISSAYAIGDWVTANCTSDKSNPPTQLSWYINGAKAEQWLLDQMPTSEEEELSDSGPVASMGVSQWLQTRSPRTSAVDARGLHSTSLGLRFVAERRFFQGSPPRVELRCEAALGDRSWERVASARLAAANNQQLRSASHRFNRAYHRSPSSCAVSTLVMWALLRLLVS